MEKVEREVAKGRSRIVDCELRNGKASRKEKEARVLSRAAERTEREPIDNLEAKLTLKGWSISTLIHDEIIIQHPGDNRIRHDVVAALTRDAKLVVRNFENAKGWTPGILDISFSSYRSQKILFPTSLTTSLPYFRALHHFIFVFSFCFWRLPFSFQKATRWGPIGSREANSGRERRPRE